MNNQRTPSNTAQPAAIPTAETQPLQESEGKINWFGIVSLGMGILAPPIFIAINLALKIDLGGLLTFLISYLAVNLVGAIIGIIGLFPKNYGKIVAFCGIVLNILGWPILNMIWDAGVYLNLI
ncbi:MAG: hypothetical protein Q4C71_05020 [Microbacteriaceae bacterium]|nr:hypothetical protein [Microbacteriaceae bacterium]